MPVPIICLEVRLRHFAERFRLCSSKPQYGYFVTVLLALIQHEGARTLSGLLRQQVNVHVITRRVRKWYSCQVAN